MVSFQSNNVVSLPDHFQMSARNRVLIVCLFLLFLTACKQAAVTESRTPKAVFIIVDGVSADIIEKINPPALAEIAKTGGFTRAYVGGKNNTFSQTPTISAVGYNSLLTGTWVHKHNVWDNDIAAPNYRYPDIFRIAEAHNPNLQTAVFSTWTDNRTKLIGEGLAQTGNVRLDYKFDGLELDTIQYPHDENSGYIHRIDEAVANEAARYIREKGPDLSWVYLQYTDDMGHRHGNDEKFYDAIRLADKQVGRIWDAIKDREKHEREDWLIVITTDHGRDSLSGKHHGGQSARERLTWIVTNAEKVNERFKQTPAVVDIMPSIANHMAIPLPEDIRREIDGVPFIGPVDFSDLHAVRQDHGIYLTWTGLNADENAEVFVSATNNFAKGGGDEYRKVGEVRIADGKHFFEDEGPGFRKILLKGPNHYVNTWVME